MATATTTPATFNRAEADRRVRHPLQAIRGAIFRYVLIEGIALTIFFVALGFWLGLAVDFIPWASLSFDWLYNFDEATGGVPTVILRVGILLLAVGSLIAYVAFKIFVRLFKEFSDPAVALLLE